MNLPFKKGEKVVYPAHGVAVIEDIQMRVISGTERRFYMLRILGTEKMTIMIPTENVESVGLRRVIGKDMVEKIYRILRQRKVEVDTQTWNRRSVDYRGDFRGKDQWRWRCYAGSSPYQPAGEAALPQI